MFRGSTSDLRNVIIGAGLFEFYLARIKFRPQAIFDEFLGLIFLGDLVLLNVQFLFLL